MNNKKTVVALLLVAIIGVVGLTVAYFTNTATIENEFQTNSYGTTVEEVFTSPDNWTPGTTTPKTLTVTNSGNLDEAVRVEVMESWMSKNGDPLPLKQNGNDAAIINWANTGEWTKVTENNKIYYYYNYKLAPTETTSTLLSSVTFNPLITNDSDCETDTSVSGVQTVTCDSTGDGYDDATYTLTFKIETVQYDKYATAWGTNVEVLAAKPEPPQPASQYLAENATNAANAEYNNETKGKMFIFTHGEGTNAVTESRYIGDEPNNYVYFNCDDMSSQSASTCEVWRILGVFDVERPDPEHQGQTITEQRMKLVRGSDFATTMVFNYTNNTYNNDWTVSPLKTFLNGDYYNRSGDATSYGLKASARSIIDEAKYYLGASAYSGVTTEQLYANERGNTVCGACNSDTKKLTWTGSVGLMYPSDEYMVYGNGVNNTCYTNPNGCSGTNAQAGWVYNTNVREGQTSPTYTWFLSSYADSSYNVLHANSDGHLRGSHSSDSNGVRPVVYLKSDIKITEGTGESGSPYKLETIQ